MKIGVLAQYLDTRSDIREILDRLSQEHEIVVYVREAEVRKVSQFVNGDISIVPIAVFSRYQKLLCLFWQYLYLILGKIPASHYNYYMTEHIKLLNPTHRKWQKTIQFVLLKISKILPGIIHYDHYLHGLTFIKARNGIHPDIEVFLCCTEIYHDWLFAQILAQHKPVWLYVYSWDHPCKMKTFSKRANYLVWHEGIKTDLIQLQNINPNRIYVWGATQFAYIHDYLQSKSRYSSLYDFRYIYLGCATGYDKLTSQEVDYCEQIAAVLQEISPEWKLVIRPYPFQNNCAIYSKLTSLNNVVFDKIVTRSKGSSNEKFLKIEHAEAFFHFGTTLGYEAGYFKTPSFLIDFIDPAKDSLLHGFVHQYQNDRYLNNGVGYNVIKSRNDLRKILQRLSDQTTDAEYTNEKISQGMPLESFRTLTEKLIVLFTENTKIR
jgi:hypothetical protein